ncbi:MAG TPA: hypothetical protein VIH67_08810 [Candidatus Acidoferrum sp.]
MDDVAALEITGGTSAATVKVTGMDAGEFVAPGAVTVTCPVYVPTVSVPSAAEICNVCGAVPLAGVTESQSESLLAVKARLPFPEFVTLSEAGPGFVLLPWVPRNDKPVGDTDNCGVGALMAKLVELEVTPPGACTLTAAEPALAIKAADTVAESCVAELKVVVSGEPFHSTVSPETKLAPLTVSVNVAPPASAFAGDRALRVGTGGLIVKLRELDVAPAPVCAVTAALPGLAIQLAGTAAASCVELPNVVASDAPFHKTVSPETKLAPLTVSVKVAPPAGALEGDSAVRLGTGGLIAKLKELDVPPDAVFTVTAAVPMLAIKAAGTAAVSCVKLPNVVASATPFHSTTFPATKLLPLTASVNAEPPAFLLEGERELSVGTGGGAGADTVSVVVTTAGEPTEPGELTVT